MRWIKIALEKVVDRNGEPIAYEGIGYDVSEEHLVKLNLHESEEQFHQLFMQMRSGFALCDIVFNENGDPLDYRFIEVNPGFENLLKRKADAIRNTRLSSLGLGDTVTWLRMLGQAISSRRSVTFETIVQPRGLFLLCHLLLSQTRSNRHGPRRNHRPESIRDCPARKLGILHQPVRK